MQVAELFFWRVSVYLNYHATVSLVGMMSVSNSELIM